MLCFFSVILLLTTRIQAKLFPSQFSCQAIVAKSSLFCNSSATESDRVNDLVNKLTLAEKVGLMSQNNVNVTVPRLGVPIIPWGEALHGVVAVCISSPAHGSTGCPSSFPHALALASSFNRTLWRKVASAIGDEARALNNLVIPSWLNNKLSSPLLLWAPNANLFRDPRWGRGQETSGEDPFLTSQYLMQFSKGIQGFDESTKYKKTVLIAKHVFDYDQEGTYGVDRGAFNAVVTPQDQANYYFPHFEAGVSPRGGKLSGLMCRCTLTPFFIKITLPLSVPLFSQLRTDALYRPPSYNSVNDMPSCLNRAFLSEKARGEWNLEGVVVSDCGAIGDIASTRCNSPPPASPMPVLGLLPPPERAVLCRTLARS